MNISALFVWKQAATNMQIRVYASIWGLESLQECLQSGIEERIGKDSSCLKACSKCGRGSRNESIIFY